MEILKDTVIQIGSFCMLTGIVAFIVRDFGAKQIRILLSVMLIVIVIRSISSLNFSVPTVNFEKIDVDDNLSDFVNTQIYNSSVEKLEKKIEDLLNNHNISGKVLVLTDISSDNIISFNARVICNNSEDAQKAKKVIYNELKIEVETVIK